MPRHDPEVEPIDTDRAFGSKTQWSVGADNLFRPGPPSTNKLPAGYYEVHSDYNGPFIQQQDLKTDKLLSFPDSVSQQILDEINTFWKSEANYKKFGFLHRRGFLLHGLPGSGKTSIIQMLISTLVTNDGIVFSCNGNPVDLDSNLRNFRRIEPERPLLCIFEDIDAITATHGEEKLLAILDGENLVDHVINVGTTNYLEKLDDRLKGRPRRFDRVIKVELPTHVARREYLQDRFELGGETLSKWVEDTDGFSFASLADLVISVKCLGISYNEALKLLKAFLKQERKGFNAK